MTLVHLIHLGSDQSSLSLLLRTICRTRDGQGKQGRSGISPAGGDQIPILIRRPTVKKQNVKSVSNPLVQWHIWAHTCPSVHMSVHTYVYFRLCPVVVHGSLFFLCINYCPGRVAPFKCRYDLAKEGSVRQVPFPFLFLFTFPISSDLWKLYKKNYANPRYLAQETSAYDTREFM